MRKQKLVGIIHELTMGGAERMMVNILNHFSSNKDEVHLIIFKNIGTLKNLLNTSIIIHDLGGVSVKKGMPKCLKEIYKIEPNTVFSGIGHLNIALAPFIPIMRLLLPKTEWISRETNIVSLQNQEEKYPKFFDYLYRKVYKNFDVIITQSQDMKEDLELNYPLTSSKIRLINNPIDIEKVKQLAEESVDYHFEKGMTFLISVGTLRNRKRHDLLLKAFSLLPPNYILTIVGSGAEEQKLKALSVELKINSRVHFEGHKTNPYPYMKRADLSVLTSEHEGFPNVILEANSLGTPVVAFACLGGITEIIEEGVNGFSVKNGDVNALAKSIINATSFKFKELLVVDSVQRRYSKEIILKRYENIFYNKEVDNEQ
ncbi:transferase [hydrothermal vent metagenome]|uniref:Transferase n=1 Tax=hydrothermal vent metagenome TaxID=652676 RepID=A0A1W1D0M7_9ZZZZ